MSRAVTLTAAGHPAVTGRHGKTLEITAEAEITARASCVLGTGAGPLPGGLAALRGRVRLELATGGVTAAVEGEVNPYYASTERLVVRRSDLLDGDTFLVNATAAAADLDRSLVERLRVPAARLEVTATELGEPAPVLLVLLGGLRPAPPPPHVAALAAQADLVVDLTGAGAPPPPVELPAPRRHGPPELAALAGARTVIVLAPDPAVLAAGSPARARLDTALPGMRALVWPPPSPAADLLVAAGVRADPVLYAGTLPPAAAARADLVATARAVSAPVALTVDPATVPAAGTGAGRADPVGAALTELRAGLPAHTLLLPDPAVGWGTGAGAVPPGAPLEPTLLRGLRHAPALVLVPAPDRPAPLAVDPDTLARLLRGAGLSGRDTAGVLAALGLPRRQAYRTAAGPPR